MGGSLYSGDVSEMHQFRPSPVGEQIYYYAEVDPVLATRTVRFGGEQRLVDAMA